MKVQEYRDLLDGLRDQIGSTRCAATTAEHDKECDRLLKLVDEVEQAKCPTAKSRDELKCENLLRQARELVNASLMRRQDNSTIEADYHGAAQAAFVTGPVSASG